MKLTSPYKSDDRSYETLNVDWSGFVSERNAAFAPLIAWIGAALQPSSIVQITQGSETYEPLLRAVCDEPTRQVSYRCWSLNIQNTEQVPLSNTRRGDEATSPVTGTGDSELHWGAPEESVDLLIIDASVSPQDFPVISLLDRLTQGGIVILLGRSTLNVPLGNWTDLLDRWPSLGFAHGDGALLVSTGDEGSALINRLVRQGATPEGELAQRLFDALGALCLLKASHVEDLGTSPSPPDFRLSAGVGRVPSLTSVVEDAITLRRRLRVDKESNAQSERWMRETALQLREIQDALINSQSKCKELQSGFEKQSEQLGEWRARAEQAEANLITERHGAKLEGNTEQAPIVGPRKTNSNSGWRSGLARLGNRSDRATATIPPELLDQVATIFDTDFYRERYPDVAASTMEPWDHFLQYGLHQLRRPSPLFDPEWYLTTNPGVLKQQINPLMHYLVSGGFEELNPIPEFDSAWYLEQYPDVLEVGMNPLLHYVRFGVSEGRDPNPTFDTTWYLQAYPSVANYGMNPLSHFLRYGLFDGLRTAGSDNDQESLTDDVTPQALWFQRWPGLHPLPIRQTPGPAHVTVVTDSLQPGSLFGGVATALVLGALLAEKLQYPLRVVTRTETAELATLHRVLSANGVTVASGTEVVFVAETRGDSLPVSDGDLFLTTSWWTTASTRESIPDHRIIYLLQEDEREFYPAGDERLMAEEMMKLPDIFIVVNTESLLRHLSESGVLIRSTKPVSFEPAIGREANRSSRLSEGMRNFFFYARPRNPRNLFYLGLASIEKAIERGVLSGENWKIHLVGQGIPKLVFCDGTVPVYHEGLSWSLYRELLTTMDIGLSLMATPHPSYPPLDLAAAGSWVVSNAWPGKPSFSTYSDRIIACQPNVDAIVEALQTAVDAQVSHELLGTTGLRPPYSNNWNENLSHVVDAIQDRLFHV